MIFIHVFSMPVMTSEPTLFMVLGGIVLLAALARKLLSDLI